MRRFSKILLLATCICLLIFTLCGCSFFGPSDDNNSSNTDTNTNTQPDPVPTTQELSHELAHNTFAIAWGKLDVLDEYEISYTTNTSSTTMIMNNNCLIQKHKYISNPAILKVDQSYMKFSNKDGTTDEFNNLTRIQVLKDFNDNNRISTYQEIDGYPLGKYGYMNDLNYLKTIESIDNNNAIFHEITLESTFDLIAKYDTDETKAEAIKSHWTGERDLTTNIITLIYDNPKYQCFSKDSGIYYSPMHIEAKVEDSKVTEMKIKKGSISHNVTLKYTVDNFQIEDVEYFDFAGFNLNHYDFWK